MGASEKERQMRQRWREKHERRPRGKRSGLRETINIKVRPC